MNGTSIDHFRDDIRPFIPQNYKTIDDMNRGNYNSRVLLGVHWQFDSINGEASGQKVASEVFRKLYPLRP